MRRELTILLNCTRLPTLTTLLETPHPAYCAPELRSINVETRGWFNETR